MTYKLDAKTKKSIAAKMKSFRSNINLYRKVRDTQSKALKEITDTSDELKDSIISEIEALCFQVGDIVKDDVGTIYRLTDVTVTLKGAFSVTSTYTRTQDTRLNNPSKAAIVEYEGVRLSKKLTPYGNAKALRIYSKSLTLIK